MKFWMKVLVRMSLLGVILGIAYLSLSPSPKLTASNDKVGHFVAYGTLMLHLGLLFAGNRKRLMQAALFAFFYGGLMEFGQYFVPGRSVSALDLLANTGGVVIGWVLTLLLGKSTQKLLRLR